MGFWWGAGAIHNEDADLVHNAERVISRLSFIDRKEKRREIQRDLAPSGKHEAFALLIGKMLDAGLVSCDNPTSEDPQIALASREKGAIATGLLRLRQLYARYSEGKPEEQQLLAEFSDLHPFRIDYRVSWIGISPALRTWIEIFKKALRSQQG